MRLKIATSSGMAAQLIQHGHVLVNNKKQCKKNFIIKSDDLIFFITDKLLQRIYRRPFKFVHNYKQQLIETPENFGILNFQTPLMARFALLNKAELFDWLSTAFKQELFKKLQHS